MGHLQRLHRRERPLRARRPLAGGLPRLVYTSTPTVLLTVVPRGAHVPLPNLVPEPSTWALALVGLGALAGMRRCRRSARQKSHLT